jgi:hypothetical protein
MVWECHVCAHINDDNASLQRPCTKCLLISPCIAVSPPLVAVPSSILAKIGSKKKAKWKKVEMEETVVDSEEEKVEKGEPISLVGVKVEF